MDQQQQQQHHQHIPDDQNPNMSGTQYGFYQPEHDQSYGMPYNHQGQIQPYQHVIQHPGAPPRQLSSTDLQQGLQFNNLSLMPNAHHYPPPVYTSPPHGSLPLPISASPPPQSPSMYDPLSPPISGSDTSADGIYHHSRNSSGTGSPSSSRGASLVHRHPIRYNPTPSPTSSSGRRGRGRSLNDSDDEDMGASFGQNLAHSRKEATRRQRIEAEQRRRDELRDGYAKLKDVLPVSNQKSSKVSLLERATNHIINLESSTTEMQTRLAHLEQEVKRLRAINEKISLGLDSTPSPSNTPSLNSMDRRPLSPPPDGPTSHSLASVRGQEPPREESGSPSASDGY